MQSGNRKRKPLTDAQKAAIAKARETNRLRKEANEQRMTELEAEVAALREHAKGFPVDGGHAYQVISDLSQPGKEPSLKIGEDLYQTPSLNDASMDPWEHLKTDPDKYYYRGLNVRAVNLDRKKLLGYEVVPGQENPYGDLILARMPVEKREQREAQKKARCEQMTRSTTESFHQEAAKQGVKTFEE